MHENAELHESCEKLTLRIQENENLLRKAKDLIQNLQADLQLAKINEKQQANYQNNQEELKENIYHLQDNIKVLESENKELARMIKEKEMQIEELKNENSKLLTQNNSDKEKLLNLQQELTIAQNDRINLQEELTQSLLLLEEKTGVTQSSKKLDLQTSGGSDIQKKLEKKTNQLKEVREAFALLVFLYIKY